MSEAASKREQWRRHRRRARLVLLLALLGSLLLHLPVYEGLGELAEFWRRQEAAAIHSEPVEIEFSVPPIEDSAEPDQESGKTEPVSKVLPPEETPKPLLPEPSRRPERPKEEPEAARPEVVEMAKPDIEKAIPVEPLKPPPAEDRQAIQQRSSDPAVAPPDSTRFLAKENNRVEEETVASLRNYVRDDPEVSAAAPSANEEPELGTSDETLVAEMREREGSDEDEVLHEQRGPERAAEAPTVVAASPHVAGQTAVEASEASEARESIALSDGVGSFVIVRPRNASKARRAREGRSARRGQAGRPGLSPRELSWGSFEQAVGEKTLEQERQAYLQERRSQQRGSSHERRWKEFRAAIENYVPDVRSGNQTALNAAASPFAEYIAAVHRKLHRSFADRFLASLPTYSNNPLSDTTLMTKMEIILNRNGSVHRVGIVRTSGFLPYDYGAFNAIMRAQPYPAAPESILSGDGRVYFHWAFYRNERQCGTFNAEPFILPNPPSSAPGRSPTLRDLPAQGGVIPSDAKPTWGEQPSEGEAPSSPDESPERPRPPAEPQREPPAPRQGGPSEQMG